MSMYEALGRECLNLFEFNMDLTDEEAYEEINKRNENIYLERRKKYESVI